ncbi:MmcQ/YjbR family DNA-binding protein [Paenibacillus sp. 22594]|uniref:MmcQ/YjbR family DNA-binding protein n=1 Tax=Paenibacillus sp. 22594 TaxID=3453947 RepID=UPI003F829602
MKTNIIEYCVQKKGATKEYPFGPEPLVIKIQDKMFALIFENLEKHTIINLKCDPVIADNLREQYENVRPGYHMNKKHWNSITLDGSVPEPDLFAMIDHSYLLVVKTLSKSLQNSILEN